MSFEQQSQQQSQQQEQRQQQQYEGQGGNNYTCPFCGAAVPYHFDLCPHCMHPLHPEVCTFCGAQMEPGDRFCCECGNPRDGITCPHCGTLNFRCFCSRCNAPLDELAQEEVARAQRDPVFQQAVQLAEEMANLEEQIMAAYQQQAQGVNDEEEDDEPPLEEEEPDFEDLMEMSDADRQLMERYRQLTGSAPVAPKPRPAAPKPQPKPQAAPPKKKVRPAMPNIEAMKAAYQQQMQRMQQLLNQMQPDANAAPQIQRNYCCAHKVVVTRQRMVRKPTTWICNYCGCEHNQPSECCRPELGGVWKYNSFIETVDEIETR